MKKGFTLVELSIVLVIIGLLIGGILVAQSMIGTAKLQSLTRQIGQFDASVANFQTKYNQLPGDSSLIPDAVGIKGDNNGVIRHIETPVFYLLWETNKFWSDLSISGLRSADGAAYTNYSGSHSGFNSPDATQKPKANAGKNAFFTAIGQNTGSNYYIIASITTGAFTPAEVLSIDTKMDDGHPVNGKVRATDVTTDVLSLDLSNTGDLTDGTSCADNTSYAVSNTTTTCNIAVRIGSTTGTSR